MTKTGAPVIEDIVSTSLAIISGERSATPLLRKHLHIDQAEPPQNVQSLRQPLQVRTAVMG
jgi:hypothetical protein